MKLKYIIYLLLGLFVSVTLSSGLAHATVYSVEASVLTGGGVDALDAISHTDIDGNAANGSQALSTGCTAIVTTTTYIYHYYYDAGSAAAEASPTVIGPDSICGADDSCAGDGNGRWLLKFAYVYDASAAFVDGDTTPDISGRQFFRTANTGGTTINDFDWGGGGAIEGTVIYVLVNDANTTFDFTASGLEGNAVDYPAANGEMFIFRYDSSDGQWHVAKSPDQYVSISDNGLIARTGVGTASARTITGDAEIVVANGDGAAGNPTLSIAASIARDTEVTAVDEKYDTDDELIAIINASPATQIGVPAGGTGAGTFTDGGILTGNTTGAINAMAVLTDGQILVGDGATEPTAVQPAREDFIPVGWMQITDGGSDPPESTYSTDSNSREIVIATFDGATDENLSFIWRVPDNLSGSTIKFRWHGIVTNATGPSNEAISFQLSCVSVGDGEQLDFAAYGAAVAATESSITEAQDDYISSAWSAAVTPTGLAAGETVHCLLNRDADGADTYAQDFGLFGIDIKYAIDFASSTF